MSDRQSSANYVGELDGQEAEAMLRNALAQQSRVGSLPISHYHHLLASTGRLNVRGHESNPYNAGVN
jgi:hypothetical protein